MEAIIDLHMMASYDNHWADEVYLQKGQILTSKKRLEQRWKWSHGRLTRFLESMERSGDITITYGPKTGPYRNPRYTIITVCRYATSKNDEHHDGDTTAIYKKGYKGKKKTEGVGKKKTGQGAFSYPAHLDDHAIQQRQKEGNE